MLNSCCPHFTRNRLTQTTNERKFAYTIYETGSRTFPKQFFEPKFLASPTSP